MAGFWDWIFCEPIKNKTDLEIEAENKHISDQLVECSQAVLDRGIRFEFHNSDAELAFWLQEQIYNEFIKRKFGRPPLYGIKVGLSPDNKGGVRIQVTMECAPTPLEPEDLRKSWEM